MPTLRSRWRPVRDRHHEREVAPTSPGILAGGLCGSGGIPRHLGDLGRSTPAKRSTKLDSWWLYEDHILRSPSSIAKGQGEVSHSYCNGQRPGPDAVGWCCGGYWCPRMQGNGRGQGGHALNVTGRENVVRLSLPWSPKLWATGGRCPPACGRVHLVAYTFGGGA